MVKVRAGNGAARKVTGPRSLMRLLGLFDALAKSKEGLTLADLNTELSSPKSSLLNLLRPLVADALLTALGAIAARVYVPASESSRAGN